MTRGRGWDLIVDLREDSPTYLRWGGVVLSEQNRRQVLVPAYCGHAFLSLEDDTQLFYLQGGEFQPKLEQDFLWSDPAFGVQLPTELRTAPILSKKDTIAPTLHQRRAHVPTNLRAPKRVLVIGARGLVGSAVMEAFTGAADWQALGTYHTRGAPGLLKFDMEQCTAEDSVACREIIAAVSPAVVVIAAGWSWVDGCQKNPSKAFAANQHGPAALAAAAQEVGARTVFLSTDYVHGGRQGGSDAGRGYKEDAREGEGALQPMHTHIPSSSQTCNSTQNHTCNRTNTCTDTIFIR